MAQIPVLLIAKRSPRNGEKVLTPTEHVATIIRVEGGFVHSDPRSGPASILPVSSLRWFAPLDLWAPTANQL